MKRQPGSIERNQLKHTLSIVIPAYREEKRIGSTLAELAEFLKTNLKEYAVEVVVVAADSDDDTAGVVNRQKPLFRQHGFRLLKPGPKEGKGRDVQYGMLKAKGDYRIFMDADLATPLHHLIPAVDALVNGADIVIGVRDIRKIHAGFRSVLSQGGNILSKLTVNVYHKDTQCGFKGFTAAATKVCFGKQKIMGWGFDIEMLAIAKLNHFTIAEVHIYDWQAMAGGSLSENVTQAAIRTLRELGAIRKNIKSGTYSPESSGSRKGAV